MKKRLARVLAATLAASTVLTGCGGGSEKKSANGKAPEKQKITEDVTKTEGEINVWTNLSQDEMNFYVEEFNKIVPGVKVNVTVAVQRIPDKTSKCVPYRNKCTGCSNF